MGMWLAFLREEGAELARRKEPAVAYVFAKFQVHARSLSRLRDSSLSEGAFIFAQLFIFNFFT